MKQSKYYTIKSKELIYRKDPKVKPFYIYILLSILSKIPTRLITRLSKFLGVLLNPLRLKCKFMVLNKELLFYLHSNLYDIAYHGGMPHELRISENVLRLTPENSIFFDIGCAIGWYSVLLSDKCKKIIGFDSHDKSSLLNTRLNRINNFEFYPYFLSDHQEPGDVETTTLDDLIEKGFPLPDVIKIDIEGQEYKVFLGARNLFINNPPKIVLVETHSKRLFSECLRFLKSFNYDVYSLGCPKVNTGGDIYPLLYSLETDAFTTRCQTRILLGFRK